MVMILLWNGSRMMMGQRKLKGSSTCEVLWGLYIELESNCLSYGMNVAFCGLRSLIHVDFSM